MFNLGVEEIPPKPRRKEKGIFFFFQSTWNGTLGIPLGSWLFKAGSTAKLLQSGSSSQVGLHLSRIWSLQEWHLLQTWGHRSGRIQSSIGAMFCLQDTSGTQLWVAKYSLKTIRYSLPSFRGAPQESQGYWGSDTYVVAQHPGRKAVCLDA